MVVSSGFILLNYQYDNNVTFEYRMNGGAWMPFTGAGYILSFVRLAMGSYDIDVRAVAGGEHSTQTCRLRVVVEAPWYLSPVAIICYIAVCLAILVVILIYRRHRRRAEFEEEKMRLLINATHDIRSPLTLILSPLAKLKGKIAAVDDGDVRVSMNRELEVIDHNANRLLLLVNQILDVRKIDKNQMKLQCRETDMARQIEQVCRLFRYNAEERDINFRFLHPEVPVKAWIDPVQFDKVISNLLSNAFKYSSEGGEVTVSLVSEKDCLAIEVIDAGIGIGDEKPSRLFERFYQSRRAGDSVTGTGIGLNLANKIVRLHGGTITPSNRADGVRGACFTVTLPLGNQHLSPDDIAPVEEESAGMTKGGNGRIRIMIVDDDREMTQYVQSELEHRYRVDGFDNAEDAFRALLEGKSSCSPPAARLSTGLRA